MSARAAAAVLGIVVALACARVADAEIDPAREAEADRAFHAAQARAVAGDPGAIAAFEELGAARPTTRWTDDAWAEAARLAERAQDYARARRALAQVIAIGTDEQLVRRARATRARLEAATGAGAWDEVASTHERLIAGAFGGGDPRAELEALEALVTAHPDYPRANAVRRALARGWEQEGEVTRALRWLREAAVAGRGEPGEHARIELVRALIRARALDAAQTELARLAASPGADRASVAGVRAALIAAERRAWLRRGLWAGLGALAVLVVVALRRRCGSWRAAARGLARPPGEAVFLIPIALVLAGFAATGNPVIAAAVRWIVLAGVTIAWLSGALLDAARTRGPVTARRVAAHVVVAALAVVAAAYLAVDRGRVIELVIQTWRGGHALR